MIAQLCYLLDYNYFKNNYKLFAIDLSIQQVLDTDPKAIKKKGFLQEI